MDSEGNSLHISKVPIVVGLVLIVLMLGVLLAVIFNQSYMLTRVDERTAQQNRERPRNGLDWDAPDHDRYAVNVRRDTGATEGRRDKEIDELKGKVAALEARLVELNANIQATSRLKSELRGEM